MSIRKPAFKKQVHGLKRPRNGRYNPRMRAAALIVGFVLMPVALTLGWVTAEIVRALT